MDFLDWFGLKVTDNEADLNINQVYEIVIDYEQHNKPDEMSKALREYIEYINPIK